MIEETFVNHRLQNLLKKEIRKLPKQQQFILKTLDNCGSYPIDRYGGDGVSLIASHKHAKFIGARMCNQSWCCPVCASRQMSKYANKIDAACQALAQEDLVPIMITFTIFHTISLPLEDSLNVLRRAYNLFSKSANWRRKKADGSYYKSGGAWCNFVNEFNIKHSVKACEITYGKHGWHPHLHCLFWIKKNRLQEVLNHEQDLLELWRRKEERAVQEILKDFKIHNFLYLKHDLKQLELEELDETITKGLYISKNEKGEIRVMDAGSYICGWKASSELTASNIKNSRKSTSYSMYQLMETALLNHDEKLIAKYIEFCLTVIKNRVHRIDFSRTGLNAIIKTYMQTHLFKEYLKKKHTEKEIYQTICWFTCQQWKKLSYINDYEGYPIHLLLLRFALFENAYELICELMQVFDLPIPATHSLKFDDAEIWNKKHA